VRSPRAGTVPDGPGWGSACARRCRRCAGTTRSPFAGPAGVGLPRPRSARAPVACSQIRSWSRARSSAAYSIRCAPASRSSRRRPRDTSIPASATAAVSLGRDAATANGAAGPHPRPRRDKTARTPCEPRWRHRPAQPGNRGARIRRPAGRRGPAAVRQAPCRRGRRRCAAREAGRIVARYAPLPRVRPRPGASRRPGRANPRPRPRPGRRGEAAGTVPGDQPAEPVPVRHHDQAAGGAGQQRAHLGGADRVVQQHQHPLSGQQAVEQRGQIRQLTGCAGVRRRSERSASSGVTGGLGPGSNPRRFSHSWPSG
jgi:hypothetical protein